MAQAAVKLHALKSVGNFTGDTGDVERWLDRMELAMRIDGVPTEKQADVLAMHLEGAAYDIRKGLSTEEKKDATAIKAELLTVFDLQRMDAWSHDTALGSIVPGDTVHVTFEEIKKLLRIAAEGGDPMDRMAACLFTARLSPHVREQVLLKCGKERKPAAVVARSLMLININKLRV